MTKLLWLFAVIPLLAGCQGSQFASCQNDAQCADGEGRCLDAKCVQCRGEDDCKAPLICGRDHTCKSLVSASVSSPAY